MVIGGFLAWVWHSVLAYPVGLGMVCRADYVVFRIVCFRIKYIGNIIDAYSHLYFNA